MNTEIHNLCFQIGLYGTDEQKVAKAVEDWGESVVLSILDTMTKEQPRRKGVQKELRIAQFNRHLKQHINDMRDNKKYAAINAQVEKWKMEWEHSQERGFVASKKQLEDQVADLYDSDQILEYAPRNIPQELREDPVALKAKLLEWGIKGASMVHEMMGVEPPKEADDDVPF